MSEERCICCGDIIPEGRQFCPVCEWRAAALKRQNEKRRKKSARDMAYNKKNIIQKVLTFNRQNPEEMIMYNYLKSLDNPSGYIKWLIKYDMAIKKAAEISKAGNV